MSTYIPDETKPVIAILTTSDKIRHFNGNRNNFRDIIRTGKEMGFLVYVVTVRDLKLEERMVNGYVPSSNGKIWYSIPVPLPQIIYNRIPTREDEEKPAVVRKIAQCLEHPGIKLYNPYFFNKWNLFEWLKGSHATSKHVPKTRRLRSANTLTAMLNNHTSLYLKPESGKAGKGIMRLKYRAETTLPYRLQIQSGKKNVTYKAASIERLWARIGKEKGTSRYIVQQAIELATHRGRPFDLRVLLQKNSRGGWAMTGIGARLAGARSITTHVPRGGSIEEPSSMLESTFGTERAASILKSVPTTALLIARQIERASDTMLGEMSMDLGVDENGGLWFFEANSRPMKFDEPAIRKLSLERIFHYGQHLARHAK
ncbi:endospore coat-associated protein [Paenibacillus sp. FSL R5-0345]|uniref:YheC/YheD family endospore coat-associated protein n=1 Tax=Paenibacillus sp. FSL R5-0345 TaxID=1536770 RepID=UPI0004F8DCDE|nr:YheC/YheD family protein [Paenibacillus sp. FSL R5-0345]AIQ34827.1 endospore coat-associated protein [Paenibacillus sp. FSL R5-0345]